MALFTTDRPNPLKDIATKVGAGWAAAAGVVGALGSYGLLTSVQTDAVVAVGEALDDTVLALGVVAGGVLPLVTALVAAFGTAAKGEKVATPSADPVDVDGVPLVRPDGENPLGLRRF